MCFWRPPLNLLDHPRSPPDLTFRNLKLLPHALCRATLSGLETQLILKRSSGVSLRSQFEFVVTAPPFPKQEFTDHTGKQAPKQRSHSPAPTACLNKTLESLRNAEKDFSLLKSGRFHCMVRPPESGPARLMVPIRSFR